MPYFSARSLKKLITCEKPLQDLFNEVVKHTDCVIIEGHRDRHRQSMAFRSGHSKVDWPNSRHNREPSQAVDVMPYPLDWTDNNRLREFAGFVKGTAIQMGIDVEWGGDFKTFFDGAHWQLKR